MAASSSRTLQNHANETGHQAGTLEKVSRLPDLLQETARDRVLADRPALKGGTVLNLFHPGLDRLSVDFDLNQGGALDRSAMEAERPDIDTVLDRLLMFQGHGIRRRPGEHAGSRVRVPWSCTYPLGQHGTRRAERV